MKRSEKEKEIEKLSQLFQDSDAVFVTDYLGLNVAKMTTFRKNLRDKNIKYRVAKNTLLRIAAQKHGLEKLTDFFKGPVAIAFGGDDPTIPAKLIYSFAKENGKPEIVAFYADGVYYQKSDLKTLAELPSKNELIARLVGTIGAPLTNLVGTLDGVIREFCVTLDQIAKQKGT